MFFGQVKSEKVRKGLSGVRDVNEYKSIIQNKHKVFKIYTFFFARRFLVHLVEDPE